MQPEPLAMIMAGACAAGPLTFLVICVNGCCANSAFQNEVALPAYWRSATDAEVAAYSPEFCVGMQFKMQILAIPTEVMYNA